MTTTKLFYWKRLRGLFRAVIPLLLLSVSVVLVNAYNPSLLNFITAAINHHPISLCLVRWGALFMLITTWPYLAEKIGNRYNATPDQITQWKQERWRIGIWLILFELLINENLIGNMIHLIGGT